MSFLPSKFDYSKVMIRLGDFRRKFRLGDFRQEDFNIEHFNLGAIRSWKILTHEILNWEILICNRSGLEMHLTVEL